MDRIKTCALALLAGLSLSGCLSDDDDAPPPPPPPPAATGGTSAVVLEWNQLLTDNQGAGSLFSFRQYAMLHIAMFDAVNAVRKQYRPYRIDVDGANTASDEAAAAKAARDVMVSLYPAATAAFDAALAARISVIPSGAAQEGMAIGQQVAQAVLQWRTADGAASADPAYSNPALPGLWQPTAAGQVAAGTRFANIVPFALVSPTQYLPAPPPPLDSAEYAANYQQVHDVGRATSTVRTADQTLLARLIAGVNYRPGPFALWNSVARSLAQSRNLSLVDTARLFAMLNVSMHDSLQTSHTSKFIYHLWRPVTAIAGAADDVNAATIPDATWVPLLTTPPYPSHSSNVSCIANGAARALARTLGSDTIPFNANWTWTGAAGAGTDVTRPYTSLSQLADEAGMSRVYGGIHFEFEINASAVACTKVADYVYDHYMTAR